MAFSSVTAHVTLESYTPYNQSLKVNEPFLEGESAEDYDRRTWRKHLHVRNGKVFIPARAVHMALTDAAAYAGTKIQGAGNKTWTKKFASGIGIFDDIDLDISPEDVGYIDIWCSVTGSRGPGPRVQRRYPRIESWDAEFDIHILDPIINKQVFEDTMEVAGMFIGIGQYRPQNSGTSGRFRMVALEWNEQLQPRQHRARIRAAAE